MQKHAQITVIIEESPIKEVGVDIILSANPKKLNDFGITPEVFNDIGSMIHTKILSVWNRKKD